MDVAVMASAIQPLGASTSYVKDKSVTSSSSESENSHDKANSTDSQDTVKNNKNELNLKLQQQIARLKNVERKVRAHETAHKSVGGSYAGAVTYGYSVGPDGKRYITSGEVSIDMSAASTPMATVRKMQVVRAAALAPADPSPQDRMIATRATQIQIKAAQEAYSSGDDTPAIVSADKEEGGADDLNNSIPENINEQQDTLMPRLSEIA